MADNVIADTGSDRLRTEHANAFETMYALNCYGYPFYVRILTVSYGSDKLLAVVVNCLLNHQAGWTFHFSLWVLLRGGRKGLPLSQFIRLLLCSNCKLVKVLWNTPSMCASSTHEALHCFISPIVPLALESRWIRLQIA